MHGGINVRLWNVMDRVVASGGSKRTDEPAALSSTAKPISTIIFKHHTRLQCRIASRDQ